MPNDQITVIGSDYFQPIADLIDKLCSLKHQYLENGYSASITVLLTMVLESYIARLRFTRDDDVVAKTPIPDLLKILFQDLPNHAELRDVFIVRNAIVHNHLWHKFTSTEDNPHGATIKNPKEFKINTNREFDLIDIETRKTKLLGLNADPTKIGRNDAQMVFKIVWATLAFMKSKSYADTPLTSTVHFRGHFQPFENLIDVLENKQPL